VLGPGDYLGESALVVESSRSATINVVERSIFFGLEKANFGAFLRVAPSLEQGILLHTKERLLQVYRQLRIPMFAEMADGNIKDCAGKAVLEHYQPGDVVCRRGDEGKAVYGIVSGSIEISDTAATGAAAGGGGGDSRKTVGGSEVPAGTAELSAMVTLSPGQYFGEISMLLHDQLVTATCTAGERTTLLALSRKGFVDMFENEPELAAYMRIKILRYGCTLHDVLTHRKSLALFRKFVADEYADESLLFYDASLAFKALPEAERLAAAKKLVEEYLPDGAPRQINVPSSMQKAAMAALTDGSLCATTFEECRNEVYALLARDTLPRFMQAKPFGDLLTSFGSYDMASFVSSKSIDLDLEVMAA